MTLCGITLNYKAVCLLYAESSELRLQLAASGEFVPPDALETNKNLGCSGYGPELDGMLGGMRTGGRAGGRGWRVCISPSICACESWTRPVHQPNVG